MKSAIPYHRNWVYFKVYGGCKTLERWLVEMCYPEIASMLGEGWLRQWFFIRYRDPEPHLRIRLNVTAGVNPALVLARIQSTANLLLIDHRIWKMDVLTYRPEHRMYGKVHLHLFERLFHIDSESVLEALTSDLSRDLESRWLISLALVDELVGLFFHLHCDRVDYYREVSERYRREFNHDQQKKVSLDKKFREIRNNMDLVLSGAGPYNPGLSLTGRNHDMANEIRNIRACRGWYKDQQEVLIRIFHLRFNRLFPDHQRLLEWMAMELLFRYYRSANAHHQSNTPQHEKNPVSTAI
ncbi:MAG: hypothetical protein FJY10_02145 [Bacteroidetes bacterium]|nr:hypothetical protein [Bacteroidota bacterium]